MPSKIDDLRSELIKLQKQREKVVLKKGLMAQDNKDLRENSAYDFYEQQERNLTGRILRIIEDIQETIKNSKESDQSKQKANAQKNLSNLKKVDKIKIEPHKWK